MYEALNLFLDEDSWHTHHWADKERFFLALDKIVRDPSFKPEKMGEYIALKYRQRFAKDIDPRQLQIYTNAATVVQEYLTAVRDQTKMDQEDRLGS
jgi:hypothetical protein